MKKKYFWFLFAFAVLLRFLLIWKPPFWYDENFTLLVARMPITQAWQAILGDVHPPLWYAIMWPLAHLVTAPWLLRIPAALFSLASLYLAWRLFRLWGITPAVQSAALTLLAILPFQLWYAQEARMYAMLEFLVLLAVLAIWKRRWVLFCVAAIALLYTMNYGPFYLAVFGLLILLRGWRLTESMYGEVGWNVLLRPIKLCLIPTLAWAPWALLVMRQQMIEIQSDYWIIVMPHGIGAILNLLMQLFFLTILPSEVTICGYIIVFFTLIWGLYYILRHRPNHWLTVMLLAFGPLAIALIASAVWEPLLLYRPLIGSTPFLYLLVCWPLEGILRNRRTLLYVACFLAPLLIISVGSYYRYANKFKGGEVESSVLPTLAYVREHWQPGDVIVHTDDGSLVNLLPYSADLRQIRLVDCTPAMGSLSPRTRATLGVPIVDLDQITYKRAWVFAPRTPLHPACYEAKIAPLTHGDPVVVVDDNQYITSGVWLVNGH